MPENGDDRQHDAHGKAHGVLTLDLRLLATSDLHVNIAPFDYHSDQTCPQRGLAMTASLISAARAEATNSLLFDNGDFLHGSPLGDFVAMSPLNRHPMIEAMNTLGYDAVNLGNHEFSIGVDCLLKALECARFPVLASNVVWSESGAPFLRPMALLSRQMVARDGSCHEIHIGVAGLVPPQTAIWDRQAIAGRIRIGDMLPVAQSCIEEMRAAGADIIVILAHCGIDAGSDGTDLHADPENVGLAISRLAGIDALVLGHAHLPFPGPAFARTDEIDPTLGQLNDIPTVMPGFFGSHLGVIDLELQRQSSGWTVVASSARLRPIAERDTEGRTQPLVAPDATLLSQVARVHEGTRQWIRKPISTTRFPLHSFFAMVTDVPAIQLIHHAQIAYLREQLRGTPHEALPVLSATAPFKAGGRGGPDHYSLIPAGELLIRHAADLYAYLNTVVAIWLTGSEIRQWLEHAAVIFNVIHSGQHDQPLINTSIPHFHFDSIGGVTYDIDLTCPPLSSSPGPDGRSQGRIRNLCWQGEPVKDDQRFILVTNSYRASGSGGFINPDHGRTVFSGWTQSRDVLIDHLRKTKPAAEPDRPCWKFLSVPNTSVMFETSPKAFDYMDDVAQLKLAPMGLTPDGFMSLRLTL